MKRRLFIGDSTQSLSYAYGITYYGQELPPVHRVFVLTDAQPVLDGRVSGCGLDLLHLYIEYGIR